MNIKSNSFRWLVGIVSLVIFPMAAYSSFHTWKVNEIYSSADGSVQFIVMKESSGLNGQNALPTHSITCAGSLGTKIFNFPTNLSSSTTANKFFIIGTTNFIVSPGSVPSNYIFTNAGPFLSANNGTINFASGFDVISYTNLPSDGIASLLRSGSTFVFNATNSPKNFFDHTNSIVPVGFLSASFVSNNLVTNKVIASFRTATGVNGGTGPNYALQASDTFPLTNWTTISNITGNGSTKTISISPTGSMQVFRLKSP